MGPKRLYPFGISRKIKLLGARFNLITEPRPALRQRVQVEGGNRNRLTSSAWRLVPVLEKTDFS
jgi:hypothetical protein